MHCILALDQSTSATKAILFDEHGRQIAAESKTHRQSYPRAGWVEHDAEEIWQNTLLAVQHVLAEHPDARPVCVSIANQRETVVVLDRKTGRPLAPAIVWQCRRGDEYCHRQLATGHGDRIRQRTGLRVDGYFSASKLQWLVNERPDIAELVARGDALFATIDAYLVYRLTDRSVFATDPTNASRTLLFDIHRLTWDDELCHYWEVPGRALPEVRSSDATFGETTLGGIVSRALPIRGVMGDSQAALFGHGCLERGSGKVTLGTGASVMVNLGGTAPVGEGGMVTALAWVRSGKPTYATEGIINSCASTLSWLRDQLGVISSAADSEQLSIQVRDDQSVYLVPAFSGLGAPYWRDTARAAIVGLSSHSDRRHIVKAALESIAFQLRDVFDAMSQETGVGIRRIRVDGGAASNGFLMQFVSDVTGIEFEVATDVDSAAFGAALMAAEAIGLEGFTASASTEFRGHVRYRPTMPACEVEKRYGGWQRAVGQVMAAQQ